MTCLSTHLGLASSNSLPRHNNNESPPVTREMAMPFVAAQIFSLYDHM